MIHLDVNGKAKCGTSSYRRPWLIATTNDIKSVNCRKCLGTGRKPQKCIELSENIIGKILHYSWGYDMTINEFYVIKKQTAHSVLAEEIGSIKYGGFSGSEIPDVNKKTGNYVRFLVKPANYSGDKYYFIGNGGKCATIHNGKSLYFNTLD